MTCLLKKKKKTAHACKTGHLQWFHKHVCTRDDRVGNTRTASLQGKNPPTGSPPLGLVPGPPVSRPCRPPRLQLGGHTDTGKMVCPALTCWAPSASSPGFSRCLHGSRRFHGDMADEASTEVSRARSHRVSRRGCGMGLDERKGQTL